MVLAARLWFVLVAALVGWVAHRLLRDHVTGGLAGVAVLLALVPQPYDLVSMSYNTAPGLLLLLACAAGTSTVLVPRTRRSLMCGAAAAAAALVNPLAVVGSLLTLLVVVALSRRWATVKWVGVGAAFTSVVGLVLLTGFGFGALGETLAFTSEYQEARTPPGERLRFALEFYGSLLASPWVIAGGVCGVAALVPRLGLPVRRGLACLAVVLVGVVALRVANPDDGLPKSGMTSGVLAVVLVALVLVPAVLVAVVRRDRVAGVLLLTGVLPFVVQAPVLAAATSSSPVWGVPAAAAAPAVLAVAVTLGRALGTFGPRWLALVVVLVATAHTLQPYRDAPFWEARLRTSGPLAGLLTGDSVARESASLEAAIQSCQRPGEGLLAYGAPAAYLFSDGPVDSNIIWLSTFAQANERTVSWIERTGREPDCVVVHSGSATRAPRGSGRRGRGTPTRCSTGCPGTSTSSRVTTAGTSCCAGTTRTPTSPASPDEDVGARAGLGQASVRPLAAPLTGGVTWHRPGGTKVAITTHTWRTSS